MSLSSRQQQVLSFIRQYIHQNQFPPTIREIGESVGISSTSVVNYNLNVLEKKGFIERDKNLSRGLRLVDGPEHPLSVTRPMPQIPLLGYIAAGEPTPIPESSADFPVFGGDVIEIPDSLLGDVSRRKDMDQLFALKVRGDSMVDALVKDGDIIILKQQPQAENGEMVAAWLRDKHETTLKKFYLEGSQVRLQPANPTMDPMYFPAENVEVRGKVVMVIRQMD